MLRDQFPFAISARVAARFLATELRLSKEISDDDRDENVPLSVIFLATMLMILIMSEAGLSIL